MTLTFFELLGRSANVSLSRLPLSASNESNEADWGPRFWWVDSRQGDPQLPATKLMEWKSHEIHILILSQEIQEHASICLMFMVEISGYLIFFAPHSSATWKIHATSGAWWPFGGCFRDRIWWFVEWKFLGLRGVGVFESYFNWVLWGCISIWIWDISIWIWDCIIVDGSMSLPSQEEKIWAEKLGVGRRLSCFKLPSRIYVRFRDLHQQPSGPNASNTSNVSNETMMPEAGSNKKYLKHVLRKLVLFLLG